MTHILHLDASLRGDRERLPHHCKRVHLRLPSCSSKLSKIMLKFNFQLTALAFLTLIAASSTVPAVATQDQSPVEQL